MAVEVVYNVADEWLAELFEDRANGSVDRDLVRAAPRTGPGPDSTQMDPLEKERQLIQQLRTPESDQSGEDVEQPAPPLMGMLDPITAMIRLGAPMRAGRGPVQFIRWSSLTEKNEDEK